LSEPAAFDLTAYLDRVGYRGDLSIGVETLRALHVAHAASIPFENLDVRLGRPVALDLGSLQDKLVRRRRGGYCFEQNGLLAAALRAIGFRVETLEARVRPPGSTAVLPRTHMVLAVEAGGRSWLADVGFGGDGPPFPVPLDGEPSPQQGGSYAVREEADGVRVLSLEAPEGRRDLYAFTLVPAQPIDYEVAHHFTSTHPRSPFVQTLTVQKCSPEGRLVLRGRVYSQTISGAESSRELSDPEVAKLLTTVFGLEIPEEDVRRALTTAPRSAPPPEESLAETREVGRARLPSTGGRAAVPRRRARPAPSSGKR
jgi:N-hydroxyarylamine O-acetyltransferase